MRLSDTASFLVCRSCNITHVGSDHRCSRTHQRLAAQRAEHRGPSTVLLPDRVMSLPQRIRNRQGTFDGRHQEARTYFMVGTGRRRGRTRPQRLVGRGRRSPYAANLLLFCVVLSGVVFIFMEHCKYEK